MAPWPGGNDSCARRFPAAAGGIRKRSSQSVQEPCRGRWPGPLYFIAESQTTLPGSPRIATLAHGFELFGDRGARALAERAHDVAAQHARDRDRRLDRREVAHAHELATGGLHD